MDGENYSYIICAMAMKTGMVMIATMVVKLIIPAETSASRPYLVASIVVMAALEAEQAMRHDTVTVLSVPNSLHRAKAMQGEMSILIAAAT